MGWPLHQRCLPPMHARAGQESNSFGLPQPMQALVSGGTSTEGAEDSKQHRKRGSRSTHQGPADWAEDASALATLLTAAAALVGLPLRTSAPREPCGDPGPALPVEAAAATPVSEPSLLPAAKLPLPLLFIASSTDDCCATRCCRSEASPPLPVRVAGLLAAAWRSAAAAVWGCTRTQQGGAGLQIAGQQLV